MSVKRWQNDRVQFFTASGVVANGYRLFFYTAGTSTKQNTFTDNTGGTPNSNYLTLDSTGRPSTEIWLTAGTNYKVVLATPGTDDPPNTIIWSEDNVSGINDPGTSTSPEWTVSGLTATYISASSFSVTGDQTAIFTVGRRLKAVVTGGTSYSTVTASSYSNPTTTITVDVCDSIALDSGLNSGALSYGLLDPAHTSVSADAVHTKSTAIASATTAQIWKSGGDLVHISGTTTITSFGTAQKAGQERTLIFDGALTLTNGTNLVLPGGQSILTVANDRAIVRADTTTKAVVIAFIPANGNRFAGEITAYAGSAAPSGWLECDGSAVLRATYAGLFAAIGTSYGVGDGSTTFNIPEFLGRVVVGKGTGITLENISGTFASNAIAVTSNTDKWVTGFPITVSSTTGFSGLANGAHWIVRISSTSIKFASSLLNAQNGSVETITGTGSATISAALTARALGAKGGEEAHAMSSTEILAHVHGGVTRSDAGVIVAGGANVGVGSTDSFGGNAAMNNMQPYGVAMFIIKT